MGQIPNEIRKGTLSDCIVRALGITRTPSGVERFSETLGPVLNPWGMPEWAYLRQEKLCAVRRSAAAVALNTSGVAICNTTPGLIVVVEQIGTYSLSATWGHDLGLATDALISAKLTNSQLGFIRDTRWNDVLTGQAIIRYGDALVPPATRGPMETLNGTANVPQYFLSAVPIILHPGQGAVVLGGVVNQTVVVNFGWRERKAYPGELV